MSVQILPDGPCNAYGPGTKIILANTFNYSITATIRQDVNGESADIYVTVGANQQSVLGCTVGIDGASQWSWNLLSFTNSQSLLASISRRLASHGQHPCTHEDCICQDYVFGGAMLDYCQRQGCGHRDVEHNL